MNTASRHPGHAALQRYGLGESDAAERLSIEEHLSGCAQCNALVDADRRLDAWLVESAPGPVPRGTGRATFDRLWAALDAEAGASASAEGDAPGQPDAPAPITPIRRAHTASRVRRWVTLAAAGLVIVALRAVWLSTPQDAPGVLEGSTPPVAGEAGPVAGPGAGPAADPDEGRGDLVTPSGITERLDPERLARARSEVALALVRLDEDFPTDDLAFRLGCDDHFEGLRREGWPVTHLVRDHALEKAADARLPALRYAAIDRASAPTLVRALDRARDAADALWILSERPHDAPLAASVARALGRLLDAGNDRALDARDLMALELLRRPGGEVERLDVTRRALARTRGQDPAAPEVARTLGLIAALPAGAAIEALATLADRPALRPVADTAFLLRARLEPVAAGVALGQLARDARLGEVAIEWATEARLVSAAPGLVSALERAPEDPALLEGASRLAGPESAAALFALWREHRHRPAGARLERLLVSLLDRDAEARRALGASLQPRALDDLLAVLEQLPPDRRGDALLAFLGTAGPSAGSSRREHETARAGALSSLARLGDATDAEPLLAWIETAGDADRELLALAWATAAVLDGETSLGVWTGHGRDADVLASAGSTRHAWPLDNDRPPTRLLRDLDRSLRRSARPEPPEAPRDGE